MQDATDPVATYGTYSRTETDTRKVRNARRRQTADDGAFGEARARACAVWLVAWSSSTTHELSGSPLAGLVAHRPGLSIVAELITTRCGRCGDRHVGVARAGEQASAFTKTEHSRRPWMRPSTLPLLPPRAASAKPKRAPRATPCGHIQPRSLAPGAWLHFVQGDSLAAAYGPSTRFPAWGTRCRHSRRLLITPLFAGYRRDARAIAAAPSPSGRRLRDDRASRKPGPLRVPRRADEQLRDSDWEP
jgi:hypothetical protein